MPAKTKTKKNNGAILNFESQLRAAADKMRGPHPRGETRFKVQDTSQRINSQVHKHAMTDELRKDVAGQ